MGCHRPPGLGGGSLTSLSALFCPPPCPPAFPRPVPGTGRVSLSSPGARPRGFDTRVPAVPDSQSCLPRASPEIGTKIRGGHWESPAHSPEGVPARPGLGHLSPAGESAPHSAVPHSHGTEVTASRFLQTRLPQMETSAPPDRGDTASGVTEGARGDGHAPGGAEGLRLSPPEAITAPRVWAQCGRRSSFPHTGTMWSMHSPALRKGHRPIHRRRPGREGPRPRTSTRS